MGLAKAGIGLLATALLVGSAYYWLRVSSERRQSAITPAREAPHAAPPRDSTPTEPVKAIASRSTPEAEPKKIAQAMAKVRARAAKNPA